MSIVFLVHGYSIIKTSTYGQLHRQLAAQGFQLEEVFLGRYISLDDDVEVRDLARAMDSAIRDVLKPLPTGTLFHMLTHSTGALIAKHWLLEHYNKNSYPRSRLQNLVFLAGPHFGSRLAHHGKSVLARVWREGDVGRRVLNALELGSEYSWDINLRIAAEADFFGSRGIRPYCVSGDKVSNDLLRHVSLAREKGSDEVVRGASANLNFRHFQFNMQRDEPFVPSKPDNQISGVPYALLRNYTHSGSGSSIMQSISAIPPPSWQIDTRNQDDSRLNLKLIVKLLNSGTDDASYSANAKLLAQLTDAESRRLTDFAQLQLRFRDRAGRPIEDFYVEFGIVQKKQVEDRFGIVRMERSIFAIKGIEHMHKNTQSPHMLTLFVDRSQLKLDAEYGMRIYVEPQRLYHYEPVEGDASIVSISGKDLLGVLLPRHHTTLIDVTLDRVPERGLFLFDDAVKPVNIVAIERELEAELAQFVQTRDYRRLDQAGRQAALSTRRRELEGERRRLIEAEHKRYHVEWRRDGQIVKDGLDE
jgi:hypothetical protein